MRNWILVLTFFCLWISTKFNPATQQFLAYAIILTVGVLHGANDIVLLKYLSVNKGVKYSPLRALSYYISVILLVLVLFYFYPPLALLSFIVISSYHFGEQHFGNQLTKKNGFQHVLYFLYGNVILFILFMFNVNKVSSIILEITGFTISHAFITWVLFTSIIGFLLVLLVLKWKDSLNTNLFIELFYLMVLFLVFRTADLLWGFAIYFVFWHSVPSLADQIHLLNGNTNTSGLVRYLKSSWLYWAISITGLGGLYLMFWGNIDFLISVLIYFLAAITFPHVLIMSQLEKT